MDGRHFTDAGEFLDAAGPLLLSDRARNQLILGIFGAAQKQPDIYDSYEAWAVFEDDGAAVAAASMTAPWNLVLADARSDSSVEVLATTVASSGSHVPGVVGNRPTIDGFARAWCEVGSCERTVEVEHGVFALETVTPLSGPPGLARPMVGEEFQLVLGWWQDFNSEALPSGLPVADRLQEILERTLDPEREQAMWIFEEDGEPVSMSAHSSFSFGGARIGPVYTPPVCRGKGYGTSLVAAQSRHLLELGLEFVYLFTDLSNQTSNSIYRRIGYKQVAESAQVVFIYEDSSS